MRCPTLAELPPPPAGLTGWPWTIETPALPPARRDGAAWPRISIVTPSYNQGPFIEETIRSVLLQGYPDLEYIIIDGGSTDQTVEIIRKYECWLTYWTSEKDRGQAHAINKGFAKATGVIGAYINSDDIYLPNAFPEAAHSFMRHGWDLLLGRRALTPYSPRWRWLRRSWWKHNLNFFPPLLLVQLEWTPVHQESTFWNLTKYRDFQFDESLHVCLDPDWYFRIAPGAKIKLTSRRIGFYRYHPAAKAATLQALGKSEGAYLTQRATDTLDFPYRDYERLKRALLFRMPIIVLKALFPAIDNFYCYTHPTIKSKDDSRAGPFR